MVRAGRDSRCGCPASGELPGRRTARTRRLVVVLAVVLWLLRHGLGGNVGVGISLSKDPASVVVETLVYNLEPERLVWAATSETKNPKNVQQFIGDLVKEVVKEMRDMKLVPQDAR